MSSTSRRGGRGRGGGANPSPDRQNSEGRGRGAGGPISNKPTVAGSPGGKIGRDPSVGLGSPSRFGHFAKYTKPKIGPAFQCAVPQFIPPGSKGEGAGEGGDESGSASASGGSGSVSGGYGTRSSSGRGGRGGRGGRRGGRGGRGRGRGGRGRGRGAGGNASEAASKLEQTIAGGEKSAVDIANAAAEDFEDAYGSRTIPRGGLCIHRPLWHRPSKMEDTNSKNNEATAMAAGLPLHSADGGSAPMKQPTSLEQQEDFLTYTRNIYLQTPRPHSELSIDEIWDDATAQKFKVDVPAVSKKGGRGKGRGNKRKAAVAELAVVEEQNQSGKQEEDVIGVKSEQVSSAMDVEQPLEQDGEKSAQDQDSSDVLPFCGLEADEQALYYLQANYHGDLKKAKLSIMVNSDRGYGVQRRRQLKKKQKEANAEYPDATTFTSESWRWRVHQARPAMLGDFRSSSDPTYPYFDPSSIDTHSLLDHSRPWRLTRFGEEDAVGEETLTRPRSFSITWSTEEIEKGKIIWKSILAYTKHILGEMEEERDNDAKTTMSDLLELAGKAHALPTPEEAFGRRDPAARQMSENMNAIIDAIESGRDCVAKILKYLKDDGEGIELDALKTSLAELEQLCPVGLAELETVKRQVHDATLWEEKLDSNVDDHGTADSDASDGDNIITEKKLTLEKVERLVLKGRNLTLRPRSLVLLQNRVERAHILRRKISVWNEARNQENPQNMKFISSLIKQANKIDLAFPELFTLTGVHKKAEEWMDRASIAARTTISFEELTELVSVGEGLPLNVSDVLEKLQKRFKQAKEWMARLEQIVPNSDDYLLWLRRFRSALEDSDRNAYLLSLLSEGSRIPVTMECSQLLQIEIDARHWTAKAKPWIPENLDNPGETSAPQKRGKLDDVKDHLARATALRDRLWFGEKEKEQWVLEGEPQLAQIIDMANTWLKKNNYIISYDSRRKGKLQIPMSELRTVVDEVNQIPLNLGNPSTKTHRIFTQADDWMKTYYPLLKRCGINCSYVPDKVDVVKDETMGRLKVEELSEAVEEADSNVSVNLDEVVKIRELLDVANTWLDQVNEVAPKNETQKKKGKQPEREKHSMKEISDLIDQSPGIIVDITDELERLKLEQSTTLSWRLRSQQILREIIASFAGFRKERAEVCSYALGPSKSTPETLPVAATDSSAPLANQVLAGSMTTRHINSRRGAVSKKSSAATSGSVTPSYQENGGKILIPLATSYLKSAKSINTITPEGSVADELNDVMSWFTKVFKVTSNPSDAYDRNNFSKLEKAIENGQTLLNLDAVNVEEIPEDKNLINDLRQGWTAAVKDDVDRLLDLKSQRDKFVAWCEQADELISSTDKKVEIDTLKELYEQSASFPETSEIVMRVRKRAKDSIAWVSAISEILKAGKKIPLEEAKAMSSAGDKLNINCPEYKELRAALRTTRSWLTKVKKCGASDGQGHVAANLVTDLINEHNSFLVTAQEACADLKQVMCGYCVCRQPYEGFMIGCDGCEEWYHGPCVGISQEQAQKFDKYVCVRCSTLRVYKDNAATVAGILRKWSNQKGLTKARSNDSQRYGRKVRGAERDIVKAKADLEKYERELNSILGVAPNAPQLNGEAAASVALPPGQGQTAVGGTLSQAAVNGNAAKSEKALRDKIGKAHTTIGNCEKRMEGYKVELVERKNLEAREDTLALNMKKWAMMVRREVFSPMTMEVAESSRPQNGTLSAPMEKATKYAEILGVATLPDTDVVLNSFKIFSWCLHSLGILIRKPRVDEIRSLLTQSDSGYFKLPEAKCVRMLRSMSSRAQIWQSKVKKVLAPVPGETRPYDLALLKEHILAAKQIPLIMPEESRILSTIEDGGNRHCICGGPSDGSFMLGCDHCDRWYHGSCVKIDKETGDALSKWICPPCLKAVPAPTQAQQQVAANEGSSNPLPLIQPQNDISPHAPNPTSLWPPFGLRDTKEAVVALGRVGDSDNEDFQANTKPIARAKTGPIAYQQNIAQRAASTTKPPAQNASATPIMCQPVVAAKSNSAQYPSSQVATASSSAASGVPIMCQPIANQNPAPTTSTADVYAEISRRAQTYANWGGLSAPNASHNANRGGISAPNASHYANRGGLSAPNASHVSAYQAQNPGAMNRSLPSQPVAGAPARTSAYTAPVQMHTTTSSLSRAGLSAAAVANMDAYVVGTHPNPGVPAPYPTGAPTQRNVPNAAQMNANGQAYAAYMSLNQRKAP